MKQQQESRFESGRKAKLPQGSETARGGRVAEVLSGQQLQPPPIWLMRQAGRYLPEYRALRARANSFLDLCLDPVLASEITMQPVARFDLDAAILFSDILVVPFALGCDVSFVEGEGPRLEAVNAARIGQLNSHGVAERLQPVMETVSRVRRKLSPDKTLIGFCGAPWTVATYMIAGRGTADQAPALSFIQAHPFAMQSLIDRLVEASSDYLIAQFKAGADVVQIFDSWAGVLSDDGFERWVITPTAEIVRRVRESIPDAKVIGFPKGAGIRTAGYVARTGVDGIGIDASLPLSYARDVLQRTVAVQGNLDPAVLVGGGKHLDGAVDAIIAVLAGGRFIFNLGHGILPETPVANIERLIRRVRGTASETRDPDDGL
jgi:uroporphyrinogen decarboxylase